MHPLVYVFSANVRHSGQRSNAADLLVYLLNVRCPLFGWCSFMVFGTYTSRKSKHTNNINVLRTSIACQLVPRVNCECFLHVCRHHSRATFTQQAIDKLKLKKNTLQHLFYLRDHTDRKITCVFTRAISELYYCFFWWFSVRVCVSAIAVSRLIGALLLYKQKNNTGQKTHHALHNNSHFGLHDGCSYRVRISLSFTIRKNKHNWTAFLKLISCCFSLRAPPE